MKGKPPKLTREVSLSQLESSIFGTLIQFTLLYLTIYYFAMSNKIQINGVYFLNILQQRKGLLLRTGLIRVTHNITAYNRKAESNGFRLI